MTISFPRLAARTMGFKLGAPQSFTVAPDGSRIAFLRTPSGTERATQLWSYDVATGEERLIANPARLLATGEEELSQEERARRERSRTAASGIVAYTTDASARIAAFALSSRLWIADLDDGEVGELPATGAVLDPRLSPDGQYVAYVSDGALRVIEIKTAAERVLAAPESETVTWGLAEFVAGEELHRFVGTWWAPDSSGVLAERADNEPVQVWHIADPANPDRQPIPTRYPAAGTPNADVTLWLLGLDGARFEVSWDRAAFPYVMAASWTSYGPPLIRVLSRDGRTAQVLSIDVESGATTLVHEDHSEFWIEIVAATPRWLPDGRLVMLRDDLEADTRRLAFDDTYVTLPGLQVDSVLAVTDSGVVVSATGEPTEQHVVVVGFDGSIVFQTTEIGLHAASAGSELLVLSSAGLEHDGVTTQVLRNGEHVGGIASLQELPPFAPNVTLLELGDRALRTGVLFPRDHTPGSARLPILLDPYGGPHGARVRASRALFLTPQWLADQGFCVVVADGRGTPNRGPAWEHLVHDDFVGTLDDQVEAVAQIAAAYPDDVDTSRVAIRGWSYGGYLAALAVLKRPDVFHAAIAGAPVTDWRLYDTAYTERYLGHPDEQPEVYERNSLSSLAPGLKRPLLLIHGLADDNVVAAHTLRLSSALLAAGRPHTVLPLTGVTHMTPQEVVAENLLLLQVEFLRSALRS
ncbi:S9 family peptidase [Tenggerimyces flavus]|uniref:Prolyl oligopeptidase family serine peptidase n=1 Tax=Tenggerimyces flavus TaxID=1708749 RepID=A0ABV7YGI3_9ACTN|nr:prolyl oligopeptidase family serine peptidase [Tenggerimyces flavus]MBM7790955.1 dipeptidyl-peptidase-4 [Tenggerimyces flavus]